MLFLKDSVTQRGMLRKQVGSADVAAADDDDGKNAAAAGERSTELNSHNHCQIVYQMERLKATGCEARICLIPQP